MNLAGWTRKVTGKPAMTVGSVSLDNELVATLLGESARPTGINRLLEMLARGDFDLVGIGRALLSNPDWPKKIRSGAWGDLNPYTPKVLESLY